MTQFNELPHHDNLPSGRSARPSPRKKADKGLPDEAALRDLARTYIDLQRRLWPDLTRTKFLPARSEKSISTLADQFRERFLGDSIPRFEAPPDAGWWKQLGAAYLRYSCENSNPRSLDQQLKNVLERAARDGVFIPWEYVFADAAVSGTTAARRGYQMAKVAVELDDGGPHVFYVDEIGRASRDAIEALRLGRLIEVRKKRMVGVTDGFDSDGTYSKIMLQVFAMLQAWFVDQLRSKVLRGMADGFARGKNLGKPALGYKLAPMTDTDGRPVTEDEGEPVMVKVIDEGEAEHVREAFRLFAVEHWSKGRIARWFNSERIGGMTSWDGSLIRQLLRRETYFGVEYYGMTYRVVDPDTGDITIVRRPQKEWKRRDVPHLRIVPPDLEAKAKERLKACRAAYLRRVGDTTKGPSRASVYPTVLVRPVCGYCGSELYLGRSGKYASFCCLNGSAEKNGCRLRTYKTVRIVEQAVVSHIQRVVFTPEFVAALVGKANAYLKAEGKRPKGDATRLRAEIKVLTGKRDQLLLLWEECDGELDDVTTKLMKYKAQLAALQDRLREIERPAEPLATITAADVEAVVADLHALLREDVAAVAPILRELTGPVTVTQEEQEGKRGAVWIARFAVNLVPAAARLTRRRNCPTSGSWEFLSTRGWTTEKSVAVRVRATPRHEVFAAEAVAMKAAGASIETISHVLGMTWQDAKRAVARGQASDATLDNLPPLAARGPKPAVHPNAAEIIRLRDEKKWSFVRIAAHLGISNGTATRVYDGSRTDEMRRAAAAGATPDRGHFRHLEREVIEKVEAMLRAGQRPETIAEAVGCGVSTVYRERRRLGLVGKE